MCSEFHYKVCLFGELSKNYFSKDDLNRAMLRESWSFAKKLNEKVCWKKCGSGRGQKFYCICIIKFYVWKSRNIFYVLKPKSDRACKWWRNVVWKKFHRREEKTWRQREWRKTPQSISVVMNFNNLYRKKIFYSYRKLRAEAIGEKYRRWCPWSYLFPKWWIRESSKINSRNFYNGSKRGRSVLTVSEYIGLEIFRWKVFFQNDTYFQWRYYWKRWDRKSDSCSWSIHNKNISSTWYKWYIDTKFI